MLTGSTVWRGLHTNGLGAERVHGSTTKTPSIHGVRQEAALHRGVPMQRRRHEPRTHGWHPRPRVARQGCYRYSAQPWYVATPATSVRGQRTTPTRAPRRTCSGDSVPAPTAGRLGGEPSSGGHCGTICPTAGADDRAAFTVGTSGAEPGRALHVTPTAAASGGRRGCSRGTVHARRATITWCTAVSATAPRPTAAAGRWSRHAARCRRTLALGSSTLALARRSSSAALTSRVNDAACRGC